MFKKQHHRLLFITYAEPALCFLIEVNAFMAVKLVLRQYFQSIIMSDKSDNL